MTGGHAPPKFLGEVLKRQFIGATLLSAFAGASYWLYHKKKSGERADYFRQLENENFTVEGQKSKPKKVDTSLLESPISVDLKKNVEAYAKHLHDKEKKAFEK